MLVSYDVTSLFTNVPLEETIQILADKAFSNDWFNQTYKLNLSRGNLVDLLRAATNRQLFQFNGSLFEQTDGVAMGSPLGPLLANVFMCSIEEKLEKNGSLPSFYRRYMDDTITIMDSLQSANSFLETLNGCHPSAQFTMEVESEGSLPFVGVNLLNRVPRIETKVYIKPTNTGLLLHYQSHVDIRYKRGLLATMLDRAYRLSSNWKYFITECDRLRSVFRKLKYPENLINASIKHFVDSRASPCDVPSVPKVDVVPVIIPFKDQDSANYVKRRINNLSAQVGVIIRPVFTSMKINSQLRVLESKPVIVNQQCLVYKFKCNLCDAGYVGYTAGHLHTRVERHRAKTSSVYRHYFNEHNGSIPDNLLDQFSVLHKCRTKFDCLIYEMLLIQVTEPELNVQTDSIRGKVFARN